MSKALIFLGAPGSGKGTQAKLLQEKFDFIQISTGDLLRKEVSMGTSLGLKIKSVINSGKLVNNNLVEELLKVNVNEKQNYIFDGFPRSLEQAMFLENFLLSKNIKLLKVFYFEIDINYVIKRILDRKICAICKKEFNITLHKIKNDICPNCNKPSLLVRGDDNEFTIRNRIQVYLEETFPILDFYKKKNKDILIRINAMDAIDVVFQNISTNLSVILNEDKY